MSSPIKLPMSYLRGIAYAFLPDTCDVLRYTETNTGDGLVQAWAPISTGIRCRVSPRGISAVEGIGAEGQERARSVWTLELPALTDVTAQDRITVHGADRTDERTFEVTRADQRSYEAVRTVLCDLVS